MEEQAKEEEEDDNFSGSTVSDHDLSDPDDDVIIEKPSTSSDGKTFQATQSAAQTDKLLDGERDRRLLVEEIRPNGTRIFHVTLPQFDGTPQFVFKSRNLRTLEIALLEKLSYMKEKFAEKMNNPFKCQVCWQELPDHQTYMHHIVTCPVSCEECGELFPTKEEERQHYETHKIGSDKEKVQ